MTGLIGGTATGLTEGLKTHMKRQGDAFDSRLKAALESTERRRIKHDKDREEAETALEVMSSLTGGDLSKAELLINKTGGASMTQDFVTNFLKASRVDPSITIDRVAPFLAQHEGSLTSEQALNAMVGKFSATLPAEQEKTLFGDPRNLRKQLSKQYEAMGIPVADAGSVQAKRAATPGAINQSLLRTPDEEFSRVIKQQQVDAGAQKLSIGKQTLAAAIKNNSLLTEKVKNAPEMEKNKLNLLALQIKQGNFDLKTAQSYDRPTLAIAYKVQEATLLDKQSGKDYEENLVKIDTQLHMDMRNLKTMELAGESNTKKYKELQARHNVTLEHRQSVASSAKQFGASSTLHSKINPIAWHTSMFKKNLTANGVGYEVGIDGAIKYKIEGQGPQIHLAFAQTFKQLYNTSRDKDGKIDRHMVGPVKEAFAQMVNNEQTIVQNAINKITLGKGETLASKAKPLYLTTKKGDKFQHDGKGFKVINPDLNEGDLVLVNARSNIEKRKEQGYTNQVGVFMSASPTPGGNPYILGRRQIEDVPLYNVLHSK